MTQCVSVADKTSTDVGLLFGVSQGSIQDQIFNVYIPNQLVKLSNGKIINIIVMPMIHKYISL